jgi:hypothetical protein
LTVGRQVTNIYFGRHTYALAVSFAAYMKMTKTNYWRIGKSIIGNACRWPFQMSTPEPQGLGPDRKNNLTRCLEPYITMDRFPISRGKRLETAVNRSRIQNSKSYIHLSISSPRKWLRRHGTGLLMLSAGPSSSRRGVDRHSI